MIVPLPSRIGAMEVMMNEFMDEQCFIRALGIWWTARIRVTCDSSGWKLVSDSRRMLGQGRQ